MKQGEVLIVEEQGRLTDLSLQLPVQPFADDNGIRASVLLIIGPVVTVPGIYHDDGYMVDGLEVSGGVLIGNVGRAADQIQDRCVEGGEALGTASLHRHGSETGVQGDDCRYSGIMGDGKGLGTSAGLPHHNDMLYIDQMEVFSFRVCILVCQPVKRLEQLFGVRTERSLGAGIVLVRKTFALFFLGCCRLFRRRFADPCPVGKNHIILVFRITPHQDIGPVGVRVFLVEGADSDSDITIGGHVIEQEAHLDRRVRAGTVGIQDDGELALRFHGGIHVHGTVHSKCRQAFICYDNGFVGT